MARQSRSHRTTTGSPTRDLFLAGIGAVSLGRKQAAFSAQQPAESIESFRARAGALVQEAEAKATRLQKNARTLAVEARAQVEARLTPVLARFGVVAAPKKKARTARKPAAKRGTRRTRRAA